MLAFAEAPAAEFSATIEPVTHLSLSETIQTGQLAFTPRLQPNIKRFTSPAQPAVISRMPTVDPTDRIRSKMPQLEPDTATEYRMLTKPDVDVPTD